MVTDVFNAWSKRHSLRSSSVVVLIEDDVLAMLVYCSLDSQSFHLVFLVVDMGEEVSAMFHLAAYVNGPRQMFEQNVGQG